MIVPLDEFKGGSFNNDTVDIKPEWGWKDAEAIPSGCANTEAADWDKLRMSWTFISPLKLRVRLRWSAYAILYHFIYRHDAHHAEVTCLLSPKITPILATPSFFVLKSLMSSCWIDKPGRSAFHERTDVRRHCRRSNNCTIPSACPPITRFPDTGSVMRVVTGTLALVSSTCSMMSHWHLYFTYLFQSPHLLARIFLPDSPRRW